MFSHQLSQVEQAASQAPLKAIKLSQKDVFDELDGLLGDVELDGTH